jgi:hypothetical protein
MGTRQFAALQLKLPMTYEEEIIISVHAVYIISGFLRAYRILSMKIILCEVKEVINSSLKLPSTILSSP